MKKIIELKNVSKKVEVDNYELTLLKNISLEVKEGEFISIMGSSGAGKSTLLNCIGGLDGISEGKIIILDNNICNLTKNELLKLRLEKIGFIFQKPYLLKNFNVFENITLPAYYLKKQNKININKKACLMMKKFHIEKLKDKNIGKISGGEAQRVSICRALINNPKLILADEPTGALNSRLTEEIMDLIININKDNKTIVMVTHDVQVALKSDKVYYIEDGSIKDCIILGKYEENTVLKNKRKELIIKWLNDLKY